MPTLAQLTDPGTWGATGSVTLRETHISWVALIGDRAYKVKKPVRMPFLDQRTVVARRAACGAELEVNARLAPSVYLALRSLVPAPGGGVVLASADAPDPVDYVVEMRRFDEADTLAARLRTGVADAEIAALGARIAAFHGDAPIHRAGEGAESAARATADGLVVLRSLDPSVSTATLERRMTAAVTRAWPELAAREQRGFIREGHGDLRAAHVLLTDPIEVVDGVEFSRALRTVDVGSDLGFLVMDLWDAGRRDLADVLVEGYRGAGGDPGSDELLALFAAERALVRAEVASLRARQLDGEDAAAATAEAQRLVALAERGLTRSLGPLVIAVTGPAASGKSTLAQALAVATGLPTVSSDLTRKWLAGVAPTEHGDAGLYRSEVTAQAYTTLRTAAAAAVVADAGVIVDATFRDPAERSPLCGLAAALDARLLVVECHVPADVAQHRAHARSLEPWAVSDADEEIAAEQHARWTAWSGLGPGQRLVVEGTDPVALQVAAVLDGLDRLAGLDP